MRLKAIHTPSCIWRRTGEIQKANQEFANLTGIPASMFRNGLLCVYELMDEDSAVRYWEGYGKIAFDAGQSRPVLYTFSLTQLTPTRPKINIYNLYLKNTPISHPSPSSPSLCNASIKLQRSNDKSWADYEYNSRSRSTSICHVE